MKTPAEMTLIFNEKLEKQFNLLAPPTLYLAVQKLQFLKRLPENELIYVELFRVRLRFFALTQSCCGSEHAIISVVNKMDDISSTRIVLVYCFPVYEQFQAQTEISSAFCFGLELLIIYKNKRIL